MAELSDEEILDKIAAIAHHGGLIGYGDIHDAMNEIRRLLLPWWKKEEADSLQQKEMGKTDEIKKTQYVAIKDMSAGNESIGETWQETKIFPGSTTLDDVMKWAMGYDFRDKVPSQKRVIITRPDNFDE